MEKPAPTATFATRSLLPVLTTGQWPRYSLTEGCFDAFGQQGVVEKQHTKTLKQRRNFAFSPYTKRKNKIDRSTGTSGTPIALKRDGTEKLTTFTKVHDGN